MVLISVAAVGGLLAGTLSGETFSVWGALVAVAGTLAIIFGLGAYFTWQDEARQEQQLPEEMRAVFERLIARKLLQPTDRKGQEAHYQQEDRRPPEPGNQLPSEPNKYAAGDLIAGKYLVRNVLGGGMGRVYVVEFDDDTLVLKTILQERGDLEIFAEEARTWVRMGIHENIVTARWVDWVSGMLCVAADYVPPQEDGKRTIRDYIGSGKTSIHQMLRWSAEFCFAMEHALGRGLIAHRDIKPENLLLGADGKLLVTDFGISKATALEWLRTADQAIGLKAPTSGTPAYMAPEQWRAEQQDFRTDVYAFGVVLFELCFAKQPWVASSISQLRLAHLASPIEVPDHPLAAIIRRALSKDMADRFASPDELLSKIAEVAQKLQVPLPPRPLPANTSRDELMAEASLGHFERDLSRSIAAAEVVTEKWPSYSPGWTQLGRLWHQQNDLVKAREATERSLKIDPTRSAPWNNLGILNSEEGKFAEAEAAYREALVWDSQNAGAMSHLGNCLTRQGKLSEAIDWYERSVQIAPDRYNLWVNLGAGYQQNGDQARGLECLKKALNLAPPPLQKKISDHIRELESPVTSSAEVLNLSKLVDERDYEAALPWLEKLSVDEPNNRSVWYNLARTYGGLKRIADERRALKALHSLEPHRPFAIRGLLRLARRRKDWSDAHRWCDQLEKLPVMRIPAVAERARLFADAGEAKQARAVLFEAIRDFPRSVEIRETYGDIAFKAGAPIMAISNGFKPALQLLQGRKEGHLYSRIMRKYEKAALAAEEDQRKLQADAQRASDQDTAEELVEDPCPIMMDLPNLSDGETRYLDRDAVRSAWENFRSAIFVADIEKLGITSQSAAKRAVEKFIAKTQGLALVDGAHVSTFWRGDSHGGHVELKAFVGNAETPIQSALTVEPFPDAMLAAFFLSTLNLTSWAWWHGLYDRDYEFIWDERELKQGLSNNLSQSSLTQALAKFPPVGVRMRRDGDTVAIASLALRPGGNLFDIEVEVIGPSRDLKIDCLVSGARVFY